jgi:hypothetical protein
MTNIIPKDFLRDDTVSKLYRAGSLLNAIHKVGENVIENFGDSMDGGSEKLVTIDFYKRLNLAGGEMMSSAHHLAKRQNINNRESTLKDLLFISTMINLANRNYHMSDMNAELLTKGCLYLRDIVNSLNIKDESVRGAIAEGVTAGVESEIESIKDNTENTLLRTYKELEGVDMRNSKTEIKVEAREEVRLKDTPKSAPPKVEKKEMVIIDDRKSSRRDQVLSLLSKDPISIKDISEKIVGCSEKTIQRELNALVDAQKITRIGEKRWSRYTLAR